MSGYYQSPEFLELIATMKAQEEDDRKPRIEFRAMCSECSWMVAHFVVGTGTKAPKKIGKRAEEHHAETGHAVYMRIGS